MITESLRSKLHVMKITTGISSAVLAIIAATVGLLLSGAALLSTGALAQDTARAAATGATNTAVLVGTTPTMSELASSQANLSALAAGRGRPVEQLRHRLPNGGLTSAPDPATLNALPTLEPNAATQSVSEGAQGYTSVRGFVGIYEGDNYTLSGGYDLEPPDQGLAVNNNVAVEINNNIVQFFNATTGASLNGPIATAAFFSAPANTSLSDTQVFFDPTTQRWFLTELIFNGTTIEDIAVAVSTTSNALGSYYIYQLRAFSSDLSGCGANNSYDCLPDYPKAGYDANIFIIDVDLFEPCNKCAYVGAASYVLPKSLLLSGSGFTYLRLFYGPGDFVVQPSIPAPGEPFVTDANGTEYLMEATGSSNVRVWAISNTNNAVFNITSLRANYVDVAAQSYGTGTVPSTQPNVTGPYCKSVDYPTPSLDGGYQAFQATVQKASGNLYGALPFASNDGNGLARDVIAWFALSPSVNSRGIPSASIVTQGYVVPPNGYSMSYPALGLNNAGQGMMAATLTSTSAEGSLYPSATFTQFTGTGFEGDIWQTGVGNTSDDGFTGCDPVNNPGNHVGRWGDYGAAVVDATSGYFYTASEMIPNPTTYPRGAAANWGTFITQIGIHCRLSGRRDFNGDCKSDILWRNSDGDVAIWLMNGTTPTSEQDIGNVTTAWSIVGAGDFNGDGSADILWRHTSGDVGIWLMNSTTPISQEDIGNVSTSWSIVGTGDFNGDGMSDILWYNSSTGQVAIWLMNGTTPISQPVIGSVPPIYGWSIVGTGDFNGDGKTDILWRNSNGDVDIWFMNGTTPISESNFVNIPTSWTIVGTGDFNGDGMSDILWYNSDGDVAIWLMNGTTPISQLVIGSVPPIYGWSIVGTGDFNGDGKSDILWRNTDGDVAIWFMNGTTPTSEPDFVNVPTSWSIQSANGD